MKTLRHRSPACIAAAVTLCAVLLALFILPASAASPTDEILNYEITVVPLEDATLRMNYHIEWKVLESDKLGPLEWVTIGIPNRNISELTALSDNIRSIKYTNDGGDYVRVDFAGKYYKDQVVAFDFSLIQSNMYDNLYPDDETATFFFTPGWFGEIDVDRLSIKWKNENVMNFYPAATVDEDWLVWEKALRAGEKFSIEVAYSNLLFGFAEGGEIEDINSGGNISDDTDFGDFMIGLFCLPFFFIPFMIPIFVISSIFRYIRGSGLGTDKNTSATAPTTKKQIKKTLIKYYPACQGCGAPRPENSNYCEYCGRSFIESETVISEEDVTEANKGTKEGDFVDSTNPNVYTRVRFVNVPVVISRPKSSCVHSSCVHSSCAHSSCACASHCACACACAGGGRAGCSTKDFYNTGLRLEQLEKYRKH
ncbi:MAG: zinc ribbon domain-containing protein [Clostridia bacterium]|nr:zinc ribbon domain-containing protein [Clostridia bacterium]